MKPLRATLRERTGLDPRDLLPAGAPDPDSPRIDCASGKHVFESRAAAKAALSRQQHAHRSPMHVYKCGFCPGWHLGHARGAIF